MGFSAKTAKKGRPILFCSLFFWGPKNSPFACEPQFTGKGEDRAADSRCKEGWGGQHEAPPCVCVCVCVSVVDWNSSSGDRFAFAPYSSPVLFDLPPPRSEVVVDFSTYTDRCSTRGGTAHSLLGQQHLHLVSSIFLLFSVFGKIARAGPCTAHTPRKKLRINFCSGVAC